MGWGMGYEAWTGQEQGRQDPLPKVLAGKPDLDQPLAGKSTLNRLELGRGRPDSYKKIPYWKQGFDDLVVDVFLEAFAEAPPEIVVDIDTTDVELHGGQEGRFFHGYYDAYCYLPLYIFSGEHLLGVRLRPANIDASAGSLGAIHRSVPRRAAQWPRVHVILRGDSGFCREELMSWCESQEQVDYVFGKARNERLRKIIAVALVQAAAEQERTQQP